MGIVSSLGEENNTIALMASSISFLIIGKKPYMFCEEVSSLSGSSGGNRCVRSMLAFSLKVVALYIVARLGGYLGKAFVTMFQRLRGNGSTTILL